MVPLHLNPKVENNPPISRLPVRTRILVRIIAGVEHMGVQNAVIRIRRQGDTIIGVEIHPHKCIRILDAHLAARRLALGPVVLTERTGTARLYKVVPLLRIRDNGRLHIVKLPTGLTPTLALIEERLIVVHSNPLEGRMRLGASLAIDRLLTLLLLLLLLLI